jgi:hypothetical protein
MVRQDSGKWADDEGGAAGAGGGTPDDGDSQEAWALAPGDG